MKTLLLSLALSSVPYVVWCEAGTPVEILSLERAHELALLNAPNVTLARLAVLVAQAEVSVARAAYFPTVTGDVTAIRDSMDNSVITAGAVSTSSVYDRTAAGVTVRQLITDFGKTSGTVDSVRMHAWAEGKHSQSSIDKILLDVDILYDRTLQSQARMAVADLTVTNRTDMVERISAQVASKLKSELDLTFAQVNLAEGKMLAMKMANELKNNRVRLGTLLGFNAPQPFQLEDLQPINPMTTSGTDLVTQAYAHNPAIARLRLEVSSAARASDAAHALDYPTLSAMGAAGINMQHDPRLPGSYAAGGFDLNIPLYTGNVISARQQEAQLRIEMATAALRAAENDLAEEVIVARNDIDYTFARLELSNQILSQANDAYDLAKTRFEIGLNSITDLDQADLMHTNAAMTQSTAKQDYLIQAAILKNLVGGYDLPHKQQR